MIRRLLDAYVEHHSHAPEATRSTRTREKSPRTYRAR
jgi:hypothetical protein